MTRISDRRTSSSSRSSARSETPAQRPHESYRETIESMVVAFILALLIKGFEAEAFVIPTGSMAPTLMGRHKDVDCSQCGVRFTVNAADEPRAGGRRVMAGTCYNCRFRMRVDDSPSFNGDRILVMKFPYDLPWLPLASPPERFDVVVFHYPEAPEQNYIKRLVGLPGEELMIHGGDLYSRPIGSTGPFRILRKPPRHQRAMLTPVYDDEHRPIAFAPLEQWRRWVPLESRDWIEDEEDPGTYRAAESDASRVAWLRYRHLVPDPWQWEAVVAGTKPEEPPEPSLIDDFCSYNTSQNQNEIHFPPIVEPHWVGDLLVEFDLEVESSGGRLVLELIEAGVPYRCTIDLGDGRATLERDGSPLGDPQPTPIQGPGRYRVAFSNIDDRLTLRVDGRAPFGAGIGYQVDRNVPREPTVADLSPVGIGADGARVTVSGLVLRRDIYYTLQPHESDYAGYGSLSAGEYTRLRELLSDPARFAELARMDEPRIFPIRPGRYMMMGDNSPRSKDGRAWGTLDTTGGSYYDDHGFRWQSEPWSTFDRAYYEVPEELLIGKAFFIYWPHGKPFGPDIRISQDFRVPFRPYLEQMKWIR